VHFIDFFDVFFFLFSKNAKWPQKYSKLFFKIDNELKRKNKKKKHDFN